MGADPYLCEAPLPQVNDFLRSSRFSLIIPLHRSTLFPPDKPGAHRVVFHVVVKALRSVSLENGFNRVQHAI